MSLKQPLPPPPFQTPFILAPFGGFFGSSPPVAKKFSPPEKPQNGAGISFPWIEFISNQHNLVNGAAPLDSPPLTGTPVAPTAAPGTSSTQIATTEYTDNAVGIETARAETAEASNAAAIAAETSRAEASEANISSNAASSVAAETARAKAAEALLAPQASPVFTGVVTAPVVEITAATPTGAGLGLGNTTGVGTGAAGNIQAPALGGGSGPATPGTIVKWLEIDLAGTKYWIPLAQ